MPNEKASSLSALGDVKGFFEVFLPGLFLLLHVAVLLYCLGPLGPAGRLLSWLLSGGLGVATAIGLPLGYVIGLALRLGRTSFADRVSGKLVFLTTGRELYRLADEWLEARQIDLRKPIRREGLPYANFMLARVAVSLPPEALTFYESVWTDPPRVREKINLQRFNFLKTLVASADEQAAKEMFASEMMVRHAAHMCYALFYAAVLLCISAVLPGAKASGIRAILLLVGGGEGLLLASLLTNLRLLRISEAELVFTCCFRNRVTLLELINRGR